MAKKAEKISEKALTDKLAEAYSQDDSLSEFADELFWEWTKEQYRVLLQQVNQTLWAVQKRISWLKQEKNNS